MKGQGEMEKRCFIPACVLVVAAIGFIIYAVGHPELSFPWSIQITHILYGLYVDAVVLLFVLAFWKKTDSAYILVVILELGAVFFLVQSILKRLKELLKLVARNREELDGTLTDKQKETLEKFEECMNEMHSITERDAFSYGFRLGVQLVAEAFLLPIGEDE